MEKTKGFQANRRSLQQWLDNFAERYFGVGGMGILKSVLSGIFVAMITMLLGMTTIYASVAPMGASFMLAISKYVPFSFAGLMVSAFSGSHKIPTLLAGITIFAIRTAICQKFYAPKSEYERKRKGAEPWLYGEPVFVRVILSVFAAFLLGVVKLIGNGYQPSDLVGMLLAMAITPLTTYIFTGLNDDAEEGHLPAKTAVYILMSAVVFSLRGRMIAGFALATIAALGLTMWMSEKGGILRGGVTGILTGMAADLPYAAAFAIAGLIAGLLWKKNKPTAVAAGTAAGITVAFFAGGFDALRGIIPDMVVTSAFLIPLLQLKLFPPLPAVISPENSEAEPRQTDRMGVILWKRETNMRICCMEALSSALSGMSEVCRVLSARVRRPGREQIGILVVEVMNSRCTQCAMKSMCWRGNEQRLPAVADTIARLTQKSGRCKEEYFPEEIRNGCRHLEKMVNEINGFYAELVECAIKSDKIEVFATEYDAMSRILEESAKNHQQTWKKDENLTEKLSVVVKEMQFPCDSIAVFGDREKLILGGGIKLSKLGASAEEIQAMFEKACGFPLNQPEFSVDDDYVSLSMTVKNRLLTEAKCASSVKNGETFNGDHFLEFDGQGGYHYVMISDGMGSGYEAALSSKLCGIFLEKLLGAGCSIPLSLEMLNNFIRSRNVENFATIDLLRIDLLEKEALFVKSGAAPSFVMRDGSLFQVASHTMPVGITKEINAEEVRFALQDDDVIVMFSDGVAESFDESIWLTEMICTEWEDDLERMAEKIKSAAEMRNMCRDDITVALIRIQTMEEKRNVSDVSRETLALLE